MNKIRMASVLLVLAITLLVSGCGGGGGSSAPVEKDIVGITNTLKDFMAAARANDRAKLESLLASPGEYYLMIEDFGVDINDPDDNASYTFYISPEYIEQPAEDIAYVKANYMLSSGEPLWLSFALLREDGRWIIDEMYLDEAPEHAEPIVPVTPPNEFIAASYNPIDNSIEKIFAIDYPSGEASTTRMVANYSSGSVDGDITFYELNELYVEPDSAMYEGFVPATSRRSNLLDAVKSNVKRHLRAGRFSLRAQVESDVAIYYGFDSQGAFWFKLVDNSGIVTFNNGSPVKLFEPSHAYGTQRTVTYTYEVDGFVYNSTITINIGSPVAVATPLQSYTAVPLTFTNIDDEFLGGNKWVEYLVAGVGEVGYDEFDSVEAPEPSSKERLLTRFNSDGSLNERNDPIITNSSTYLGSYTAGEDITSMQVTTSGGTAPLLIRWHVGGFGPEALLEGITLSSSGLISGYIAGNPPAGTGFSGNVEVVDRYGRHTYRAFTVDVEASTPGAITFSPILSSVGYNSAVESFIMLEGTSVPKANYAFDILEFSPVGDDYSYITFFEEPGTGIAKISIWGYQPGTTISFKIRATRNADGAILISDLQTVTVGLAASRR